MPDLVTSDASIRDYEPDEKDIRWLQDLMDGLQVNQTWFNGEKGLMFRKTNDNTMKLQDYNVYPDTYETMGLLKKCGDKAGIKVEIPYKAVKLAMKYARNK